ncbi:MAG: hypothetical protein P8X89_10625 [Reinekea sp.]
MDPKSKSQFARMLGVTPQYIDKIQDQLTFVNVKGKVKPQIDLHGSKTIQYLSERERKSGQQQIETQEPDPTQPKTNYGKLSSGLPGADTEELKALKKEKLEEEIEKIKIHNQQGRGSLIEKNSLNSFLGKCTKSMLTKLNRSETIFPRK